jgi:hypothetical protein
MVEVKKDESNKYTKIEPGLLSINETVLMRTITTKIRKMKNMKM